MSDKIELYKSGMAKFVQQDFAAALEDFGQALDLDPDFADVLQAAAHAHEKLGDFDQAVALAERAVACNPNDFLAHTSLSMFYQRKGMIAEAEREKALAAQLQQDF
ncbi:MAG: tetratricopeptide repeat protein [Candidatus Latescibacteria bacterium]|nr:tetratricopeptide repeat protein [Candidatus Latescibacterota bacterium]